MYDPMPSRVYLDVHGFDTLMRADVDVSAADIREAAESGVPFCVVFGRPGEFEPYVHLGEPGEFDGSRQHDSIVGICELSDTDAAYLSLAADAYLDDDAGHYCGLAACRTCRLEGND